MKTRKPQPRRGHKSKKKSIPLFVVRRRIDGREHELLATTERETALDYFAKLKLAKVKEISLTEYP